MESLVVRIRRLAAAEVVDGGAVNKDSLVRALELCDRLPAEIQDACEPAIHPDGHVAFEWYFAFCVGGGLCVDGAHGHAVLDVVVGA